MRKSEIKNGDVINNNQLKTEKKYTDWIKTTDGEWERRRKGSKTRYKINEFFNEKENITLYEKVIEDKSEYIDWIEYRVSKNGVSLNNVNDDKMVFRTDLQTEGWVEDKEWYRDGWKIGVVYTKEVIDRYLILSMTEIEKYKNKIKELENKIELFNQ
jgi:hypothetical protein